MAIIYNTTNKTVQVTAASTSRALHNDIQTVFAGATYMQYLIPDSGSIKDALYLFQNAWTFLDASSSGFMTTGGWQFSTGTDKWTNVQTLSGDSFAAVQLYYSQGGAPVNFGATGLVNALIKVRTGGTDVNAQAYTVYSRPFQRAYSQFTIAAASAGGVDIAPLSNQADNNLTIASATLAGAGYTDMSIAWASIYRSAFDGAGTTKYTLNGTHTAGVTTITVNEAVDASVPASGQFSIGNNVTQEVITYTGKAANSFTGCTRGTNRTTAAAYTTGQALSTNVFLYSKQILTTNSARTLVEAYNWIQYKLGLNTDIDVLASGKIGQVQPVLVAMPGTQMTTAVGVWIEGFRALDANNIFYTDAVPVVHTPPLSVTVTVVYDSTISAATAGQVSVEKLNTTGLTDATYTPANLLSDLINTPAVGTSLSSSLVFSTNIPVRVIVRKPGYQQFSLYTTITSAGLSVTAQNPVDAAA
jgi:hypothetical protein